MDALDQSIIEALTLDARRPLSGVAKDLGVATATVHERVKRLRERGVITGARLEIDWEQVGLPVVALISLTLREPGPLDEAAAKLAAMPHVESCYAITGEFDLLLIVRARSSQHLGEILDDVRTQVAGASRTVVVLSTYFEGRVPPLAPPPGSSRRAKRPKD
jgi:Lrp/AsnC family leucine-responsive transcriptional regulator